jgi:hypothetical protein
MTEPLAVAKVFELLDSRDVTAETPADTVDRLTVDRG